MCTQEVVLHAVVEFRIIINLRIECLFELFYFFDYGHSQSKLICCGRMTFLAAWIATASCVNDASLLCFFVAG